MENRANTPSNPQLREIAAILDAIEERLMQRIAALAHRERMRRARQTTET